MNKRRMFRAKRLFSDVLHEIDYYEANSRIYQQMSKDMCLSEKDFYPPSDDRVLKSYIMDTKYDDSFADYCEYIFNLYEEEGYYD